MSALLTPDTTTSKKIDRNNNDNVYQTPQKSNYRNKYVQRRYNINSTPRTSHSMIATTPSTTPIKNTPTTTGKNDHLLEQQGLLRKMNIMTPCHTPQFSSNHNASSIKTPSSNDISLSIGVNSNDDRLENDNETDQTKNSLIREPKHRHKVIYH
jgi:hypothetical protein